MPDIQRVGDLEIDRDVEFQRRNWKAERIAWRIMALMIIAALLGLLGPGPLNNAVAGSKKSPLWVEYDRFGRLQAPLMLRIHLKLGSEPDGKVRLLLKRDYLEKFQIEQVTPPPQSVEAGPEYLTYIFQVTKSNQPTAVTFYMQPEQLAFLSGEVGLSGKQPIGFSQFIYP